MTSFDSSLTHLPKWLAEIRNEVIIPKRKKMLEHPFMIAMQNGMAEKSDAVHYFSGLMWHLSGFESICNHLFAKRPAEVATMLKGRSEDTSGDVDILARIVKDFGGPAERLLGEPWNFAPHPVWVQHDALLRAAIYSPDFEWQVGTAALNVGIESLVPFMIEPLYRATIERYGVSREGAKWLESRSGEEEIQHGENGFLILAEYVKPGDAALIEKCRFYIEHLSSSMAFRLLDSGLPRLEAKT